MEFECGLLGVTSNDSPDGTAHASGSCCSIWEMLCTMIMQRVKHTTGGSIQLYTGPVNREQDHSRWVACQDVPSVVSREQRKEPPRVCRYGGRVWC